MLYYLLHYHLGTISKSVETSINRVSDRLPIDVYVWSIDKGVNWRFPCQDWSYCENRLGAPLCVPNFYHYNPLFMQAQIYCANIWYSIWSFENVGKNHPILQPNTGTRWDFCVKLLRPRPAEMSNRIYCNWQSVTLMNRLPVMLMQAQACHPLPKSFFPLWWTHTQKNPRYYHNHFNLHIFHFHLPAILLSLTSFIKHWCLLKHQYSYNLMKCSQ